MIDEWLDDPQVFEGRTPLHAFSVDFDSEFVENVRSVLDDVTRLTATLNTGPRASDDEVMEAMLRTRALVRGKRLIEFALGQGFSFCSRSDGSFVLGSSTRLLAAQKAVALNDSGITKWKDNDEVGAIADYSSVIDMDDAPIVERAFAIMNRGLVKWTIEDKVGALADCKAIVDLPDNNEKAIAFAMLKHEIIVTDLNGHVTYTPDIGTNLRKRRYGFKPKRASSQGLRMFLRLVRKHGFHDQGDPVDTSDVNLGYLLIRYDFGKVYEIDLTNANLVKWHQGSRQLHNLFHHISIHHMVRPVELVVEHRIRP